MYPMQRMHRGLHSFGKVATLQTAVGPVLGSQGWVEPQASRS